MMAKKRIYCSLGYKCNNNCVFCAVDSAGHKGKSLGYDELLRFFKGFGDLSGYEVEFSGGEPTEWDNFFELIGALRLDCPALDYMLLSNGRNFANRSVACRMAELMPQVIMVPIHADTAELHDKITRSQGSFNETMLGVRNLYDFGANVVLKTVVHKMNYKRMPDIVRMIANSFPECEGMTINALDVCGGALANKDLVGVRLSEIVPFIQDAIDAAVQRGLKIQVYSVPMCLFDEKYRQFAGLKFRSRVISKSPKIDGRDVELTYGTVDECKGCRFAGVCTGGWKTYFDVYGTDELRPVR